MLSKIVRFWLAVSLSVWFCSVEAGPSDVVAPITDYRRGYNDRVEYITATINSGNLDKGTPPSSKAQTYSKKMSPYRHDDAGHLIAARLGGMGNETYNIVPHNRKINRGIWRTKVENVIYNDVNAGNVVTYEVWPQYDSGTATRPNALKYKAVRSDGTVVVQDTMGNPIPDAMNVIWMNISKQLTAL